jgi:hypothetical protein
MRYAGLSWIWRGAAVAFGAVALMIGAAAPGGTKEAGLIASYDFAEARTNSDSVPASEHHGGIVAGDIKRGPGLRKPGGRDFDRRFNANGFSIDSGIEGAIASESYFTLTLTPGPGDSMHLSSISLAANRGRQGPTEMRVRCSVDDFKMDILDLSYLSDHPNKIAQETRDLGPAFRNISGPVEFRIYGFLADTATGVGSLRPGLTIRGSVTAE